MIDISQINLNTYSKDELLSFSNSGILFCGNMDLTDFVQKIMEGMYSQEELDKQVKDSEESYDRGYSDGKENVLEETIRYLSNI